MSLPDLARFVLLGAILGIDVVSFPQAMVSRPIVAATLAGLIVGQGARGLMVGVVLELIALDARPFGAARYPDWGSASVVAGAVYTLHSDSPSAALFVAVLAGLLTGWVGGTTMIWLRGLNGVLRLKYQPSIDAGVGRTLTVLQALGLAADLGRGALLTLVALVAFVPLSEAMLARWSFALPATRALLAGIAATIALAAIWQHVSPTRQTKLLFAGGVLAAFAYLARW